MEALTITFDPPGKLLSMNDRMHWTKKARATKAWREAAHFGALESLGRARRMFGVPALVTVTLPVRDARPRDPHNLFATVKPIVDGLTDAGLWPDDTSEWVSVTEPAIHVRGRQVTVLISPRNP